MSRDINVTDGTVLETLNNKIDCDGGNYPGSGLEEYINTHRVGMQLFDTVLKDHVLTYEESRGLALQGTWVYKEAIAGERYGYPDFYNKVVEEFEQATPRNFVYTDAISWTVYDAPNGHMYIDVSEKSKIDTYFAAVGMAWYYILDRANKRVFLPRNNWFEQMSMTQAGKWIGAGLPNITGSFSGNRLGIGGDTYGSVHTGAFLAGTNHTSANWYGSGIDKAITNMMKLHFDASASNPIYGASNTVQPSAVRKLLYICVGNTVSDTSWVDVVTQVEGGVKDLEDKKNTSIAEIDAHAKSYDNLTYRQITNCLLEVPQRIKLELNNGILTLKAGSEVIVPNGFEDDGITPRFDYVTVENDLTTSYSEPNSENVIWVAITSSDNNLVLNCNPLLFFHSGLDENKIEGHVYYATDKNKIYYTEGASLVAFPLGLATGGGSSTLVASINQVFNGFGYIGQCTWVDKGVKALLADGRNEDGTLKNRVVTTTVCYVNDATTRASLKCFFNGQYIEDYGVDHMFEQDTPPSNWGRVYARWYNPKENLSYITNDGGATWDLHASIYLGDLVKPVYENITSFNIQAEPLRSLTSSNKTFIRHWCTPNYNAGIGLALTNGVVPCDGYLFIMNHQDKGPTFYLGNAGWSFIGSYYSTNLMTVPVKRGQTYSCSNWGEIRIFSLYPFT